MCQNNVFFSHSVVSLMFRTHESQRGPSKKAMMSQIFFAEQGRDTGVKPTGDSLDEL